jgi:hypothetical protein
MPSELFKLIKCTGAVHHDTNNVAVPNGFFDIGVVNALASEKFFVMMKLQTIYLIMSGISQEFAKGDS